ncbi:Fe-S cluster assembly protein SufD [Inquilinus ginsengisoli]|uniref:Fe-S cluster assembly protein SufD n=1 Tax=Inquilinus ginsengisoli TaxID=363840 RepID=A0ABU1JU73_9PROT|nr:Fe-S cluster assembly protein SufD [Inquilinus ginsengisoli]MDR6291135.1 Fe-S cluster assembly protein SufD [Inquilinus ginsengisoli]
MSERITISPTVAAQRDRFAARRAGLPGVGRSAIDRRREAGMARFESLGLPTRKLEAWKYTDLRRLEKFSFASAAPDELAVPEALRGFIPAQGPSMVFVNGQLRPDLSHYDDLPAGLRLDGYAAALEDGDADVESRFAAAADAASMVELNTALVDDGAVLRIAAGAVIETPIRLVFLSAPGEAPVASHSRILILAGANSQATVIESYHGTDNAGYFTNAVGEAEIGDGARLRHYRRQSEGLQAVHLVNGRVRIGRDATYDSFTLSLGADLARTEVTATFAGTGGNGHVTGAYLADGNRHIDTTTLIDHAVPDCRSREVFKGVLDDKGRGVFQGKIIVRRDAQRTDGYQLNRALMLSRTAEIDSKPELEIYADDVKCSHGATIGELDSAALFYLRSRGIDERTARAMLVEAFLREALEEIADEAIRDEFGAAVELWLAGRHQEA